MAGEVFNSLAGSLNDVGISINHRTADWVVPNAESRAIAAALRAKFSDIRYIEFEGVEHREILRKALADDQLGPWLFEQSRSAR